MSATSSAWRCSILAKGAGSPPSRSRKETLKYPHMFQRADIMLLNKVGLLP
jgi:hypothetical protein